MLLPFFDDLSIDEASFRAHLRDVTSVDGISAITINAHSTEAASCTFDEQQRVPAITQDEIGCNGLLSGSGSVIAALQAQLFRAIQDKDLATARRVHERIYHTAEVFSADPPVDMRNCMKEALVLMGKLPRAVVRPPLVKISGAKIERIRQALVLAGLLTHQVTNQQARPATRLAAGFGEQHASHH